MLLIERQLFSKTSQPEASILTQAISVKSAVIFVTPTIIRAKKERGSAEKSKSLRCEFDHDNSHDCASLQLLSIQRLPRFPKLKQGTKLIQIFYGTSCHFVDYVDSFSLHKEK